MKNIVFYVMSENSENHWWFPVNMSSDDFDNICDDGPAPDYDNIYNGKVPISYDLSFTEFVTVLEHHYKGVLDASGSENNGRWFNGYQSYEIDEDKFYDVVQEFKKWFEHHDYICGEIKIADDETEMVEANE